MTPEELFQYANMLALSGWLALLATPFVPSIGRAIGNYVVPAALSVLYVALILAFWMSAQGGFGSLADVAMLFQTPQLLLAGWVHYLAFDLFVGAWIVRRAAEERVHFALVVPILAMTFLFGPAGLLAFLSLRAARAAGLRRGASQTARS